MLPIHNGYTSYYSLVIWGIYGFYLYLSHSHLSVRNIDSGRTLALIVSIEAIVLELLFNLSHIIVFGGYIFYYLPTGLWHLTAFQVIPFYFIAGWTIVNAIRGFKSKPWFFTGMNVVLASVLVFLAR